MRDFSLNCLLVACTLAFVSSAHAATDPGVRYTYDANGNAISVTDPLDHANTNQYDELDRLIQVTDPANGVTQYQYDSADHLKQVTDPQGFATQYRYNGFGDVIQQTSPDTGQSTFTYDSAGNIKTKTDARGTTITYSYDAKNRVIQEMMSINGFPPLAISYTYDSGTNGKGHLTQLKDTAATTNWTYTLEGRVASKSQTIGNVVHITTYTYDAFGRLQTIHYPSGRTITYGYDAAGRLQSLLDEQGRLLWSASQYQPFGSPSTVNDGNGNTLKRVFDLQGRETQQTLGNGTRSLNYDLASRITGTSQSDSAAKTEQFDYDVQDRLTSWLTPNTYQGFGYNATGDRLSVTIGTNTSAYSYQSGTHRLSSITNPSQTFKYDAAGNQIGEGANTAVYDGRGRLKQVVSGGTTTVYAVNGLGQRVKKSSNVSTVGTVYFVYDEQGHLLGEYDQSGKAIQEYVWAKGVLTTILKPNGNATDVFWVETDHLGTPRVVKDQNKAIRWQWESDPFGVYFPNENPGGLGKFTLNLRFPGQYYDQEMGNHYNYFRDYNPRVGRYVESDPIGLRGGINTYLYVDGDPLQNIDPTGLDYWIENSLPTEGGLGLHQKICVGKPHAHRICISFGVEEENCYLNCKGGVYDNTFPLPKETVPIANGYYSNSDGETDGKIESEFNSLIGQKGSYSVIGFNCRDFSLEMYGYLRTKYGGTIGPPDLTVPKVTPPINKKKQKMH